MGLVYLEAGAVRGGGPSNVEHLHGVDLRGHDVLPVGHHALERGGLQGEHLALPVGDGRGESVRPGAGGGAEGQRQPVGLADQTVAALAALDRPALVVRGVVGPLEDVRAGHYVAVVDVEDLPAVEVAHLVEAVFLHGEAELLRGQATRGSRLHVAAVAGRGAGYAKGDRAVGAQRHRVDPVVDRAAALDLGRGSRDQAEALVGAAVHLIQRNARSFVK